jgi:4-amino-4-deoxy-L-arabinose transferase-like glycosyltransferase
MQFHAEYRVISKSARNRQAETRSLLVTRYAETCHPALSSLLNTDPMLAPGINGGSWRVPAVEDLRSQFYQCRWDLAAMALLLCLNPIAYHLNESMFNLPPDATAYFTFARNLFTDGLLYVPAWGHIDTNLILPPLFPALLAIAGLLSDETLNIAEWMNSILLLIAPILMYFYVKDVGGRVAAILAVIVIQTNYFYLYFAFVPLTEAVFLLTLSIALLLLLRLHRDSYAHTGLSIALGIVTALVFLSRQIGLFMLVFLLVWTLLQIWMSSTARRPAVVKSMGLAAAAWLVVVTPYALVLYYQTGQTPLQQAFRSYEYVVRTTDPQVIQEIEAIGTLAQSSYRETHSAQRLMRKLLPDSAEMYSYVVWDNSAENPTRLGGKGVLSRALTTIAQPRTYLANLYKNIASIIGIVGAAVLGLFLLACVTPFVVRSERVDLSSRLILPGCVILYFLLLSTYSANVIRYVYIIFPFLIMHIATELALSLQRWELKKAWVPPAGAAFFFVLASITVPTFFFEMQFYPKASFEDSKLLTLRKAVKPGDGVFSLSAFHAYAIGGVFRVLPNDSLAKLVTYGKKTGVRWILVSHARTQMWEIGLYDNVKWYADPELPTKYRHLVKFCCAVDNTFYLYEIL